MYLPDITLFLLGYIPGGNCVMKTICQHQLSKQSGNIYDNHYYIGFVKLLLNIFERFYNQQLYINGVNEWHCMLLKQFCTIFR